MTSTLALQLYKESGATRLRILEQQAPWRVVRAFRNREEEALVHLNNVSGGILGGDDLRLCVDVQPGANAQITSTGATRLYRTRGSQIAFQRVMANIREGAYLEYIPDMVIPYGGSNYQQSMTFQLEEGAGLVCWDVLSAGRLASGEVFAFDELTSHLAILAGEKPIAMEQFRLAPSLRNPTLQSRFGPYLCSATMYACQVGAEAAGWIALERRLSELADELSGPDIRWGASMLVRDGVVVRGLSRQPQFLTHGLYRFWAEAKRAIWNRTASVPRKIH